MDEALEAVEVIADSELEGVFVWLLRIVGVLLLAAGLGMWLLTDAGLLVLPAVLVLLGVGLLVAPQVLMLLTDL